MIPAHVPTAFFTAAPLALAALTLVILSRLMTRSVANRCIAGFVALVVPSPLMLVAHTRIGIGMIAFGVACAIPAYIFAEDHDEDDGRGRGRDDDPDPVEPEPEPGWDPEVWSQFERDFWSHVDRTREPVNV
jgi:hypothetical protein